MQWSPSYTIYDIIKYSPNKKPRMIPLKSLLNSRQFHKELKLYISFGKTWDNQVLSADIQHLGNILIAGKIRSGKTTFLKVIICTLIQKNTSKEVGFSLVTPNPTHYSVFDKSEYLIRPIITNIPLLITYLEELVKEMNKQFRIIGQTQNLDITWYNREFSKSPMKYIFVVIDDFSELFKTASKVLKKRLESSLIPLMHMARAVGIHIILATKEANAQAISEIVKANFTNRFGFKTTSKKESRNILDDVGCEALSGKGDAIFSHAFNNGILFRIQTPYITETELKKNI